MRTDSKGLRPSAMLSGAMGVRGVRQEAELRTLLSEPRPTVGAVVAFAALSIAYLLFVVHYSVNELFADDWNVVPLVHAALHGHLSFGALWAQHGENRMFVPNVLFVAIGVVTRFDPRADMVLSALVYVATFGVFLALCRSSLKRPVTAAFVLVTGLVWFGLEDWENQLFGFQLAWYLIVFFLVVMIWLLVVRRSMLAFALAIVCAFGASYCSVQGLGLWPVGLLCLVWIGADRRRLLAWISAAVVAVVIYFWGYTSNPTGLGVKYVIIVNSANLSPSYAIRHPIEFVQLILVLLGKVVPNDELWLSTLLGAIILTAAIVVVVRSVRQRSSCVPVALIAFGLLFDAFIAVGRLQVGLIVGTASRYTMPNMLIASAIVSYGWPYVRREWIRIAGAVTLAALFGLATFSGLQSANGRDQIVRTGARLVVNRGVVPPAEQACYALWGFYPDVDPVPATQSRLFDEAQQDHLSAFGASYQTYRSEGLPTLPECKSG